MHPTDPHHPEQDTLNPATAAAFDADVPGVAVAPGGEFSPEATPPATAGPTAEHPSDESNPVS